MYGDDGTIRLFGKVFEFPGGDMQEDSGRVTDETINDLIQEFKVLDCKGNYYKDHEAKNYLEKDKSKFAEPSYCSAKI